MGYKRVPTIHTLDKIPDEDGLIVRMKGVKFGRVKEILRLTGEDRDMGEEEMSRIQEIFIDGLVSWNLMDENDVQVPLTLAAVDDQDFDFILKIISEWMGVMTGVSDELGKDSPSIAQFPGQPVTMEAL
jgi:hypothetical protein